MEIFVLIVMTNTSKERGYHLTRAWHDLYWHGENLARLVRSYQTLQEHAQEKEDWHMYEVWGECLRKVTVNCVAIAKDVLRVEEIVKGKKVYA